MHRLIYVPMESFRPCSILVVGSQPAEADEMYGKPLMSRAGKLLRKAFEDVGADLKTISFTTVIKVRTEEDRPVDEDEFYSWLPALRADLVDTAPEKIVCISPLAERAVRLLSDTTSAEIFKITSPETIFNKRHLEEEWKQKISKIVSL